MKTGFHPYALIFGIGIGIMLFFALRHPLFAVFGGVAAIVLIDYSLRAKSKNKNKKDSDNKDDFE